MSAGVSRIRRRVSDLELRREDRHTPQIPSSRSTAKATASSCTSLQQRRCLPRSARGSTIAATQPRKLRCVSRPAHPALRTSSDPESLIPSAIPGPRVIRSRRARRRSSTDIRRRGGAGDSIEGLVPRAWPAISAVTASTCRLPLRRCCDCTQTILTKASVTSSTRNRRRSGSEGLGCRRARPPTGRRLHRLLRHHDGS